jgi:hypothetical protein
MVPSPDPEFDYMKNKQKRGPIKWDGQQLVMMMMILMDIVAEGGFEIKIAHLVAMTCSREIVQMAEMPGALENQVEMPRCSGCSCAAAASAQERRVVATRSFFAVACMTCVCLAR